MHPEKLVRESLAHWLDADDGIEVVAVEDDPGWLEEPTAADVSVLLSAVNPPFRSALLRFREQRPSVQLVAVSAPGDGQLDAAMTCGATGWITSSAGSLEVVSAVHAAAQGWLVLPADAYGSTLRRMSGARSRIATLDDGEFELLRGLAGGRTIAELADGLYVSPRTVKRRVADLRRRLDCASRAELVALFGQAMFSANGEPG